MKRASFWRRREMWGGVLLTVLFHAGVFFIVQETWPPVLRARAAPFVPRLLHQADLPSGLGASAWDADPRALGSPVLFALPTDVGFSPSLRARTQALPPMAREATSASLWLDRLPRAAPVSAPLHGRTQPEVEGLWAGRWIGLPLPDDPFTARFGTSVVLQVEWPEGDPGIVAGLPLELKPPPDSDEKSWDVTATIYFTELGNARNVFIERTTAGTERSAAVSLALYRLRIAPGHAINVRVKLYLDRAAPLPVADGGASL
ncbi:MAG: hypothetical protein M5U15_12645 [Kiritimatiellae bacterium]|nr:hypothetical protein [Kiritimatiellia bacterium]